MNGSPGVYAKAIFAALMAVLTTLYAAMSGPNWDLSDRDWVSIVIAGVTALGVYLFPNAPQSVDTAAVARARRNGPVV